MLAIVTPDPDSTAETFIRQHINLVEPNNTVVVYFEGAGEKIKGLPSLKLGRKSSLKLNSILNYIRYGYSGAIVGEEKKRLLDFFEKYKVSNVLAEFGQTGCSVQEACKQAAIPLHVFFHGQDASAAGRKLKNRISYWRLGRYITSAIVATNFFAKKVERCWIPESKIKVAPYGLELEEFKSDKNKDPFLVVAVGRMVSKKAPHLTVQAFGKVLDKIPEARLEMVGGGALLNFAKKKALELGIENQVIFHGVQDHEFVKSLVSKASVFVQHSLTAPNGDTESLGVSLLEAMACETPVVTTRHNGFVETIDDGVTGFLVEERDVEAMSNKIIELLQDNSLVEKMGKAGRQRVLKYYEATQQAKLLQTILKSKHPLN